jgi:hypothetical protein
MDFKIVCSDGSLLARFASACEVGDRLRAEHERLDLLVLLDDTGAELSVADLDVLCAAEQAAARGLR